MSYSQGQKSYPELDSGSRATKEDRIKPGMTALEANPSTKLYNSIPYPLRLITINTNLE